MLKRLIDQLRSIFHNERMRRKLRRTCPTSRIYQDVAIDEKSMLGHYVVLFNGVAIHNSSIGDHTYVQKNSMINDADIGKFCSIAGGVCLGLPQHVVGTVSSHPAFYLKDTPLVKTYSDHNYFDTSTRTTVGHDVWIGQNALIMSGVRIGIGAVVGAGAVVTRRVEDYEIVAGVPAKHIRYRFDEKIRNDLLESKWWEMSENWREDNVALFMDPVKLINALNVDN